MSLKISCPKCDNNPELEIIVLPGEIEVDYCIKCEGIWFDEGELSQKLEFSRDIPDFQAALERARPGDFLCPACTKEKLLIMEYIPKSRLLIDFCQSCKGIWLDGGEIYRLQEIISKAKTPDIRFLKVAYLLKNRLNRKEFFCPGCHSENLYNFSSGEEYRVDLCRDCKGLWFDAGETAQAVNLSRDIPEFEEVYKLKKETHKSCPKCIGKNLVEFPFSNKSDLLIDYCEVCCGIWLDPEEILKLEEIAPALEGFRRTKMKLTEEGWVKY
ncbi:zf-TFIIB domain-containing protein [Candidatus Riflebacteria bacterium]